MAFNVQYEPTTTGGNSPESTSNLIDDFEYECDYNDEIALIGPYKDFPFALVNWKLKPWCFPDPIYTISSQNLNLWSRDQLKNIIDNL